MGKKSIGIGIALIILLANFAIFNINGRGAVNHKTRSIKYYDDDLLYKGHQLTSEDIENMKDKYEIKKESENYNIQIDGFGTGFSPPTKDYWESKEGEFVLNEAVSPTSTPTSYDISTQSYFPEIRSQGGQGSCAAWAMTYYAYGYLEAKDNGWTEASEGNNAQLLNPGWTYNRVNGGKDSGSFMGVNGNIIVQWGVSTWSKDPYDDNDLTSWGNDYAFREAPLHRAESVHNINYEGDTTVNTVKNLLSSDTPVTFAMDANAYDFSDNYVMSTGEYDGSSLNHAQTFVGYDDSITEDGETGAFKVANSWGQNWGDNGYYWITYDTFKEMGSSLGLYLTYIQDKPDYDPSLLGVWHFNSRPTRDSTIELGIGQPGSPLDKRTPYFATDSDTGYPNFLSLDLSEFKDEYDSGTKDFYIDLGTSQSNGALTGFKLESYENGYIAGNPARASNQALNLPKNTPCTATNTFTDHNHISLSEGVDNPGFNFNTNGPSGWTGVNHEYNNDSDSIQSGDIGNSFSSVITTEITGEITLNFDWKVSSSSYDELRFYIDGSIKSKIGGTKDWTTESFSLSSGTHNIKWEYKKDTTISQNADCGWLDNIRLEGSNLPPNSPQNLSPSDQKTGLGTDPTLKVDVSDPDGDTMKVSFYNASLDNLIATDSSVVSGGTASVTWSGLSSGNNYNWYAVADDGSSSTQSSTWTFTTASENNPPGVPTDPSPAEGTTGVSTDLSLSVSVSDPDGDTLDVTFYDGSHNSIIGTETDVTSGGKASVTWSGLSDDTSYQWYVVAKDNSLNTQSSTWSFMTASTNHAPDSPTNPSPSDGSTGVSTSPTLNVEVYDQDGGMLDVHFYRSSDNRLIGTDSSVTSGGTASVTWSGLLEGNQYSWYAVADDSSLSTRSNTWSFTTASQNNAPNSPKNPSPVDSATGVSTSPTLSVKVSDPDEDIMDITFYDASDDSVIGTKSGVNSGEYVSIMWSDLSKASQYQWYVIASDISKQTVSSTWTFKTYDDVAPEINILHPNQDQKFSKENLTVKWDGSDDGFGIDHYEVRTDSSSWIDVGLDVQYFITSLSIGYHTVDIKAVDNSGNTNLDSVSFYVDNQPPKIDDNSPQDTDDYNYTFNVSVSDISSLSSVNVYYSYENSEIYNMSMESVSSDFYQKEIILPSKPVTLYYSFSATDKLGNRNKTEEKTVIISDDIFPEIEDVSGEEAETGENFAFLANVSDNFKIDTVEVTYWTDVSEKKARPMLINEGNQYEYNIEVPLTAEFLKYNISAVDSSGNYESTGNRIIEVIDTYRPVIEKSALQTPETGDIYNLTVDVEDNIDVKSVIINYHTDQTTINTATLANNENEYYIQVTVPNHSSVFYFNITAKDVSGNVNHTDMNSLEIIDDERPTYIDHSQSYGVTGDIFTFNFSGKDNLALANMSLKYWTDVSEKITKTVNEENLRFDIVIPRSSSELYYNLSITDEEKNTAYSGIKIIEVEDDEKPRIKEKSESIPSTGENFTLFSKASDNIGIKYVFVNYSVNRMKTIREKFDNLERNNYSLILNIPEDAVNISYSICAVDENLNINKTGIKYLDVEDTISPEALISSETVVNLDEGVMLSAEPSNDNIGVTEYRWTLDGKNFTGKKLEYNFTDIGNFKVNLTVTDGTGNFGTELVIIEVKDTSNPVIQIEEDITTYINKSIELKPTKSCDNHGIDEFIWKLSNQTYMGKSINITFSDLGKYKAELIVKDISGNYAKEMLNITVKPLSPGDIEVVDFSVDYKNETSPVDYNITAIIENIGGKETEWQLIIDDNVLKNGTILPGKEIKICYDGVFNETGTHVISIGGEEKTVQVVNEVGLQPGFSILILIMITTLAAVLFKVKRDQY